MSNPAIANLNDSNETRSSIIRAMRHDLQERIAYQCGRNPMIPDLIDALYVARQHIPIQKEVVACPRGFVIVKKASERLAVYDRGDWERGQASGGVLPPSPIEGKLVGYVEVDGEWKPV